MVVEPPDRNDPFGDLAKHIADRRPPLRVVERRDHLARLVNEVVHRFFGDQSLAVDLDAVFVRVDLGAELGHHATIDAHPTRDD